MSANDRDAIGRKQPSKYLRKKRAGNAARHRWKQKWQLVPGNPIPWNRRSLANELRSMAASRRGGQKIGSLLAEQQSLFWRWYYGDCKARLRGPFKTVVETFERIEAAYVQRYGRHSAKGLAWEAFMHSCVFNSYVLKACWKMNPETIEREMWADYERFMLAEGQALEELVRPMIEYELQREERKALVQPFAQMNDDEEDVK